MKTDPTVKAWMNSISRQIDREEQDNFECTRRLVAKDFERAGYSKSDAERLSKDAFQKLESIQRRKARRFTALTNAPHIPPSRNGGDARHNSNGYLPHTEMKLYHITNGKVYAAPDNHTIQSYKEHVRKAYGTLSGVRFVQAENRALAQFKAAQGITV